MESAAGEKKTILLTFDVEDWFQVENFKDYIPFSTWPSCDLRVEKNTREILDLLAEAPSPIRATFFILGWVAERCPGLVREIQARGHEVASHGSDHHLCYKQTPDELRQDLVRSKELLENLTGQEVVGYRAPSFSITEQVVGIIQDAGFLYDSSYNSYAGHGRYGVLELPSMQQPDLPLYALSPSFYEIPVSNLRIGGKIIPWGGGGYFRLLPSLVHNAGVKRILRQNGCYSFYMHPWEIDPAQPRVKTARLSFRFRHYANLKKTKNKFRKFLADNSQHSFLTCREFIAKSQR